MNEPRVLLVAPQVKRKEGDMQGTYSHSCRLYYLLSSSFSLLGSSVFPSLLFSSLLFSYSAINFLIPLPKQIEGIDWIYTPVIIPRENEGI